jgi:hypothetical protein
VADGISFDFSELDRLAADLESAPKNIGPFLTSAFHVTSLRIKRGARAKVRRRRHFKQAARAIDYDLKRFRGFGASIIESEIGYNEGSGVGQLGNLIEFGAPRSPNSLTPGNELATTLREEEADFVRGVERAVDDAMKKAGL